MISLNPYNITRKDFQMNRFLLTLSLFALFAALSHLSRAACGVRPASLSCEYMPDPLGIDTPHPRLSWKLTPLNEQPENRGQYQSAYQILVYAQPKGFEKGEEECWNTGRVVSDRTIGISYEGKTLRSGVRYYWKVRVWDKNGSPSQWSATSWFETGLMKPSDWKAKWIGWNPPVQKIPISLQGVSWIWYPGENARTMAPAGPCFFRKTFDIPQGATILHAFFAGTADDQLNLFVNGKHAGDVGDWHMAGGIDISSYLHPGENCLAIEATNAAPSPAGLIAKVEITFNSGQKLSLRTDNSWKVSAQNVTNWIDPNFSEEGWKPAEVIATYGDAPWGSPPVMPMSTHASSPAPMLRKEFPVRKRLLSARLYICGLGLYDLRINGNRVGDTVLNPAPTDYSKRVLYNTYDITKLLKSGENCVGVVLGRGFFDIREETPWDWNDAPWKHSPEMICEITLRYDDGSSKIVGSDSSWMLCTNGPERNDAIYWGETYDATKRLPGWDQPGYDNRGFQNADVVTPPKGALRAQVMPPIKVMASFRPVSVTQPKPGVYLFDAGIVTSGWAKIYANCPKGTEWAIQYGEKLNPDGTVNEFTYNDINGPCQRDHYIFDGSGMQAWTPRFSYKGFRYVEIIGSPISLTVNNIRIQSVHNDVKRIASFQCSNSLFNTIHEDTIRTIYNNLQGKPTDTPAYEKNGWMGDANLILDTEMYNLDMTRFLEKWVDDMRDCMDKNGLVPVIVPTGGWGYGHSPEWNSVYIFAPWRLYEYCGDRRILKDQYPALKKYVAYEASQLHDGISNSILSDWVAPGLNNRPSGAQAPEGGALTATTYDYKVFQLMRRIATLLGDKAEAKKCSLIASEIKTALNTHFLDAKTDVYHTDIPAGYRQTSNILPLAWGMVPPDRKAAVLANLVKDIHSKADHLDTGILGTKYILPVLTENGYGDLAYAIANQRTFPSWGWWIANGATTLWETWELDARSRDHYMFGTIDEWFFHFLAGIQADNKHPGFRRFIIKPMALGNLTWVNASVDSVRGLIVCQWKKTNGQWRMRVVVPPNAKAIIYVPTSNPASVMESGKPAEKATDVHYLGASKGNMVYMVGSGSYHFVSSE